MSWRFSIVALAFLLAAVVAAVVGDRVRRRRHTPGAKAMARMLGAAAWWSLLGGLELAAPALTTKIRLAQLYYPGAVCVPVLFLLFVLRYTRPDRRIGPRMLAALFIIPAGSVLLAFTNEWHGFLWSHITLDAESNIAFYEHGLGFYVMAVYMWALVVVATILLVSRVIRAPRPYSRQALAVVLAVPWPFVANILYVLGLSPLPGVDLAPIGFTLSGVTLSLGLRWLGLFDLVPIAREAVLDQIEDGVLVLDPERRVVEANPAAGRLLGDETISLGAPAGPQVRGWLEALDGAQSLRLARWLQGTARHVDIRGEPLREANGRFRGWLLLIQDVTERELAREALAARVQDLEEALAQVRTLKGLVPICSHCKRIRNDSNFWEQLESYLSEHTDAEFSHGICPPCYRREMKKARAISPDKLPPR